jgi:YD repeat-containing protein
VPVGLFTGSMQYEIPIYELKNSKLSLPISLKYSSNGFVVDKVASTVGYDWSLNAGGVINCYGKGNIDEFTLRDKRSYELLDATDKYALCNNYNPPDLFTYSIPGYSGSFFVDNDGKPRLVIYNDLSITFDSLTHTFTIVTSEGVKYIFAYYCYSFNNNASWYLSSIIHPSGDTITFTYSDANTYSEDFLWREVYVGFDDAYGQSPDPSWKELITQRSKAERYLQRIDFNGVGSVVFTNSYNRLDSRQDPKIDMITILDSQGTTIKSFELDYLFPQRNAQYDIKAEYANPQNYYQYRMFLDSVKVYDKNQREHYCYAFKYNNLNILPSRFCYSKDHWGYFNGKPNTDIFNLDEYKWLSDYNFNKLKGYVNYNKTYANYCDRSADTTFSQNGLLSQISYPTGGYSNIYYEAHRDESNNIIGGCRVSRVETYSTKENIPEVKVYKYPSVVTGGQNHVYFMYSDFPYSRQVTCACNLESYNWIRLSPDSYIDNSIGSYHLCYNKVEILHGKNAENGSELHEFAASSKSDLRVIQGGVVYPITKSNNDLFNGTPTRDVFKKGNATQKEIVYNYDFLSNKNSKTLVCYDIYKRPDNVLKAGACGCVSLSPEEGLTYFNVSQYNLYSRFPYLTSKRETIFDDSSNPVITETFYTYCDEPYTNVTSDSTKKSNGKYIKTAYKYPFDNVAQSPFNDMLLNNVTSPVIEQQEYVYDEANQPLLKSVLSKDYSTIGVGLFLPVQVLELENKQPLGTGNYTTYANNLITRGGNFGISSQIKYDSNGTVLAITERNGITTSYLWSYNKQYPVVKIVGLTYDEVSSAVGSSVISSLGQNTSPTRGDIEAVRTSINNSGKTAMVTTYTYKPLVGMTTQTDPNGKTTYYEYDDFGRLKSMKDNDGNILKTYDYHYQQ